jgi:hypothetical protein
LIFDAGGIPLAVTLTGGNRDDIPQLIPLVDAVPPIRGGAAGRATDHASCSPIAATTTTSTVDSCDSAGSRRVSHAAAPPTAPDWAATAWWSSVASLGCMPSSACAPATNGEPTSRSASHSSLICYRHQPSF